MSAAIYTLMRCVDMSTGKPRITVLPATTGAQRRYIATQTQRYRRYLAQRDAVAVAGGAA